MKPESHARVSILRGEMGGGKTNTLVGFIIDRYFREVYALLSPDGKKYPCKPYDHDRVIMKFGGVEKLVLIPKGWMPLSTLKVFTNFHMFGIRYKYCSIADMIRWLNNNVITDGILGIDESYIEGDARRGSSTLNVLITQFLNQMRKRHIDLYILVQHSRLIDWRFKWVSTKEITCRFDERTRKIHLIIKDIRKNKEKVTSYWAPQYWKYFDTDEIPEMPQMVIEKALNKLAGKKG